MGWTELHAAAGDGDLEAVKRLISLRADVNEAQDTTGLTPLHVAAEEGASEVIGLLCQFGVDVNQSSSADYAGETALHRAANEGSEDCIRVLLEYNAEVNALASDNLTPLHEACRNGHANAIALLIEQKANVNSLSIQKQTPLHLAVMGDHLDAIKAMVANGAETDVPDRDLDTPADIAKGEQQMRAMGSWKPRLIMELLKKFILRLQVRISKETGMTLTGATRTPEHPRFQKLFSVDEFCTMLELHKMRDKQLVDLKAADAKDPSWVCKCYGEYFNCRTVLDSALSDPRSPGRRFVSRALLEAEGKDPAALRDPDAADTDADSEPAPVSWEEALAGP